MHEEKNAFVRWTQVVLDRPGPTIVILVVVAIVVKILIESLRH